MGQQTGQRTGLIESGCTPLAVQPSAGWAPAAAASRPKALSVDGLSGVSPPLFEVLREGKGGCE